MRISDWSSDVCSSDLAVVLTLIARKEDVATRRVKAFIQNGLVESPSEDLYLTTNYTILPTIFETNPDGDVEWHKASVEATKTGYDLVDRKSVGQVKCVSVLVALGGRGVIKKQIT